MIRFRMWPKRNLFHNNGIQPGFYYADGVKYRGMEFDGEEVTRAEEYVVDAGLVQGDYPQWRWWEVKVLMEELFRRRIIGWGEDE